jgi:hypothetical protein
MRARRRLRTFTLVAVVAFVAAGCSGGSGSRDKAGGGGEPVVLRLAMNSGLPPARHPVLRRTSPRAVRWRPSHRGCQFLGNFSPDAEQQVVQTVSTGKVDLGWAETRVFDTMGVTSL